MLISSNSENKSVIGEWINQNDSASIVKFDNKKFYEIYANDTISILNYSRDTISCDSAYMNKSIFKNNFIN